MQLPPENELIRLRDFAKLLNVHYQTLYRWITAGARGKNKTIVRLRYVVRSGVRHVTLNLYRQFIREQNQ